MVSKKIPKLKNQMKELKEPKETHFLTKRRKKIDHIHNKELSICQPEGEPQQHCIHIETILWSKRKMTNKFSSRKTV